MAWWGGWGRGWGWSMWPGRGPFSHLPPWLRPGWLFGRGACRFLFPWLWYGYAIPYYMYWPYYFMLPMMYYYMIPRWWW